MVQVGKNVTYVNQGLLKSNGTLSNPSAPVVLTAAQQEQFATLSDKFRAKMNEYYVIFQDGTIGYQKDSQSTEYTTAEVVEDQYGNEQIRFQWNESAGSHEENMARLVAFNQQISSCRTFYDFYFRRVLPVRYEILESLNRVGSVAYVRAQSEYNYLVASYENLRVQYPQIPENVLPSFYSLYAEGVYRQTNNTVQLLNNLYERFMDPITAEFLSVDTDSRTGIRDPNAVKSRYADYFRKYAAAFSTAMAQDPQNFWKAMESMGSMTRTYVFTADTIPLLTTEASKGEMFPFYNKISFSTDTSTEFANILHDLKITEELMKYVIRNPASQTPDLDAYGIGEYSMRFGKSKEVFSPPESDLEDEPAAVSYTFMSPTLKMWDIKNWVQFQVFNNSGPSDNGIITIGKQSAPTSGEAETYMSKLFTKLILAARINRLASSQGRSLKQMLDGVPAYSEAVFYKIEKFYSNTPGTATPITTYYIPNSTSLDVCNFVDTQIKYGVNYTYKITSYVLVMGNRYEYLSTNNSTNNQVSTLDSDPLSAYVRVNSDLQLRLLEVPVDTVTNSRVLDYPPIPPEVNIVPYRGIGNKVLINFNGATGDVVMDPIVLDSGDVVLFGQQQQAQRRTDGKLRFLNDDAPDRFEVFRSYVRPKAYVDFAGKRIAEVSTQNISTAAALRDTIIPNTDYYYTFRSKDIHGNISNPSPIYHVKMVKEAGTPYLIVKLLDLGKTVADNKKAPSKSMRRYVQIIPTTPQALLNVDKSSPSLLEPGGIDDATAPNLHLGVTDEGLWGEKFKIRFTSKKTGRKIDLDFIFNKKHQLSQS